MEGQNKQNDNSLSSSEHKKLDADSPSIMQSVDSIIALDGQKTYEEEATSFCSNADAVSRAEFRKTFEVSSDNVKNSFQILDSEESLQVSTVEEFLFKLGIDKPHAKVKVISIFGNTGDGKSYTLNHTFFDRHEVFKTSSSQSTCTLGVWMAFDPKLGIICFDTQGFGLNAFKPQTTRLLLKVFAVSDVIIYKTRSERLPLEMFKFLGSASKAFTHHFSSFLLNAERGQTLMDLRPVVVIFHESRHTKPLNSTVRQNPENILRNRFAELKIEIEAFSSLRYVGQQVLAKTDFSRLKSVIEEELENASMRGRGRGRGRTPSALFDALRALNEKFSDEIEDGKLSLFPDEYFVCQNFCLSCGKRCELAVGHLKDGNPHANSLGCRYQQQYQNFVYVCTCCAGANGSEQTTAMPMTAVKADSSWYGLAKYVWSGNKLRCPKCGQTFPGKQCYWYGSNKAPGESRTVKTKIIHVWPGSVALCPSSHHNTGRRVVDRVACISEAVANVCVQPTKILSSYVTDQIAPKYWRPNDQIKHCHSCKKWFPPASKKHHCRSCGEGFCEKCCGHYMPVPRHGWNEAVRVCANCYNVGKKGEADESANADSESDIRARKYGEVVLNTLSTVANVFEYPKDLIKDSVRPSYWIPDDKITECCICKACFDSTLSLHHCRACGRGVCARCSPNRQPVPKRNWESPVRVCDECFVDPNDKDGQPVRSE